MLYQVQFNDSPQQIARSFGVSVADLLAANPRKPTTIVSDSRGRPVRTWQSLVRGETIVVPAGGMVGSAITDAINALASVDPCSASSVALVCAAQKALGFTVGAGVDGKWGNDASTRARQYVPNAPAGCSPRPTWWAPKGSSNCPATVAAPSAPSASNLTTIANTALAALRADPNYCTSVKRAGTPVNTAIHNFKAAWNAANPTNPVPINTGNYEPIVQIALALALNTVQTNVPAGCGAVPTVTPTPAPAPAPAPAPSGPTVPGAVLALVGINPCLQANVEIVRAAQRALGLTADGKYGTGSASAARRLVPNAPAACSPAPLWWGTKTTVVPPGPTPPPPPPPAPIPQPPPVPGPAPVTPTPAPVPAPAVVMVPGEVRALVGINPCDQRNVEIVRAAQRALGLTADGKYGTGSASAARRLVPNAPAACSPAPLWWGAKGTTAPPGPPPPPPPPPAPVVVTPTPAPAPVTPTPPPPPTPDVVPPAPVPGPTVITPTPGPAQPIVVAPEEKKISTGAIIAGSVGALALLGVVAVAASGGKGARGARGPSGRRGKSGKRGKRGARRSSPRRKSKRRR